MRSAYILIGLSLLGFGCAKQPYDGLLKVQTHEKDLLVPGASQNLGAVSGKYLFVPSLLESPRFSKVSHPFYMGEPVIVTLRFTETTLEIEAVESDPRWGDNTTNRRPVMTIPVDHLAFKCQETSNGECTNKEEENNKIPWNQKPFFKPKFNDIVPRDVTSTPLELDSFFGGGVVLGSDIKLSAYDLSSGILNFTVDRTIIDEQSPITEFEDIRNSIHRVRYNYSLVRMDQMVSANYEPIEYPEKDESTFGFFTTETQKLMRDNRDTTQSKKTFLNRWNPKKGVVTYFMSDAFNKPENKSIREATEAAFAKVNTALEESNTPLRVAVKTSQGLNPGDIRNTMIVLVEDPVDAGIIGYGPSIANPETGEILNGRVVMYLGTIKKSLYRAYDEFVDKIRQENTAAPAFNFMNSVSSAPRAGDDLGALVASGSSESRMIDQPSSSPSQRTFFGLPVEAAPEAQAIESVLRQKAPRSFDNLGTGTQLDLLKASQAIKKFEHSTLDRGAIIQKIREFKPSADRQPDVRKELELQSLRTQFLISDYCAYPEELFDFAGSVEGAFESAPIAKAIKELFPDGNPKPWAQLSEEQQQKVIDLLVPFVWVPTLVHELGHTLGLRHNFKGSNDKSNYYSKEELQKMGVDHEVTYSSVMDYARSEINLLPVLGKYDIAALKFGYARKVELSDGRVVDVTKPLAEEKNLKLKPYLFCTDSGLQAPDCNHFDEGTTYTEIATDLIKSYNDMYKRLNLRNSRRKFGYSGDFSYALYKFRMLEKLESFVEIYKIYRQINNSDDFWIQLFTQNIENAKSEEAKKAATLQLERFKDLKSSADLANNFFLDIIKTPEAACFVTAAGMPGVSPIPLADFGPSCLDTRTQDQISEYFQTRIGKEVKVVGQVGKPFNSAKAPYNDDTNADEIDVRGIWIDKHLALQMLLARDTGIPGLETFTMNALDLPEMFQKFTLMVRDIELDRLGGRMPVDLVDGSVATIPYFYSLDSSHLIPEPRSRILRRVFFLPPELSHFDSSLLDNIRILHPATVLDSEARLTLSPFVIYRNNNTGSVDLKKIMATPTQNYYATDSNLIAHSLVRAYGEATTFGEWMTTKAPTFFKEFGNYRTADMLVELRKGQDPDKIAKTQEEFDLLQLGPDSLEFYMKMSDLELAEIVVGPAKLIQTINRILEGKPATDDKLEKILRTQFAETDLLAFKDKSYQTDEFKSYSDKNVKVGTRHLPSTVMNVVLSRVKPTEIGPAVIRAAQLLSSDKGLSVRHLATDNDLKLEDPGYYIQRMHWLPGPL